MDKRTRDLLTAAVLTAVFLLLFARSVFTNKKTSRAPTAPQASERIDANFLAFLQVREVSREAAEREWRAEWGRDPFSTSGSLLAVPVTQTEAPFTLTGIVWDPLSPVAIVNGQVLKKGDTVGPYRVEEIRADSVLLSSERGSFELPLFEKDAPASS